RSQEQEAALDARPEEERVEDLLQERLQALTRAEAAHEGLDLFELLGHELAPLGNLRERHPVEALHVPAQLLRSARDERARRGARAGHELPSIVTPRHRESETSPLHEGRAPRHTELARGGELQEPREDLVDGELGAPLEGR